MKKLIFIVIAILFNISIHAQKSPARLSTDIWNSIKFNRGPKGLTVFLNGKQNGAGVVSSDYRGDSGQKWRFKDTGREGIYYIMPSNTEWNCLAAVGGKLVSSNLKNNDYYKWKITRIVQNYPGGHIIYYSFKNVGASRYLDLKSNLLTMSYNEGRWSVDKVGNVDSSNSGGSGAPTPLPTLDENVKDYNARVTSSARLNVRSGPGTNYSVSGSLSPGRTVLVTHHRGDWRRIMYNNKPAYVFKHLRKIDSSDSGGSGAPTPSPTLDENVKDYNARVTSSARLNVRSGPGTNYSVLGSLSPGRTVLVTHHRGDWRRIMYNNKPAYVFKYLKRIDSGNPGNPLDENVKDYNARVTSSGKLNVRSGPGTNHSVIGSLSPGRKVLVTHHNGDWRRILYNNKPAYVFKHLKRVSGGGSGNSALPPSDNLITKRGWLKNNLTSGGDYGHGRIHVKGYGRFSIDLPKNVEIDGYDPNTKAEKIFNSNAVMTHDGWETVSIIRTTATLGKSSIKRSMAVIIASTAGGRPTYQAADPRIYNDTYFLAPGLATNQPIDGNGMPGPSPKSTRKSPITIGIRAFDIAMKDGFRNKYHVQIMIQTNRSNKKRAIIVASQIGADLQTDPTLRSMYLTVDGNGEYVPTFIRFPYGYPGFSLKKGNTIDASPSMPANNLKVIGVKPQPLLPHIANGKINFGHRNMYDYRDIGYGEIKGRRGGVRDIQNSLN